jgi:hypothetical protein
MNVVVAMLIEAHPTEIDRPHEVDLIVQDQDGKRVAAM